MLLSPLVRIVTTAHVRWIKIFDSIQASNALRFGWSARAEIIGLSLPESPRLAQRDLAERLSELSDAGLSRLDRTFDRLTASRSPVSK